MINIGLASAYCRDYITEIENYKQANKDASTTWVCHHKKEIELNLSVQELKEKGLYYYRPADELIFLTPSEHSKLHAKDPNAPFHSKESLRKMGQSLKGKPKSEAHRKHISESKKGKPTNKPAWNKGLKKDKRFKYMTDGIDSYLVSEDNWGEFIDIGYYFQSKKIQNPR